MVLLRQTEGGLFMSKSSSLDVPGAATLTLDRRKFLSLAPSAATHHRLDEVYDSAELLQSTLAGMVVPQRGVYAPIQCLSR